MEDGTFDSDECEPFIDGNGQYNVGEEFDDSINNIREAWEEFDDSDKGTYNPWESFDDGNIGAYDYKDQNNFKAIENLILDSL